MNYFLIDDGRIYSFEDLLESVNKDKSYCPLFKSSDIYSYFVNLIRALATGQSLYLIDSDINASEISGIDDSKINTSVDIDFVDFKSIDQIIKNVENSDSQLNIFTSGTTGQPKKVAHTVATLTRSVRKGDRYKDQIWAYAYNPTHMAGLQVFFQAFFNANTLVNVFNKQRSEVYSLIEEYNVTHISATPTFYRLLLPVEKTYDSIQRVTLGGEKSDNHLYENIVKIFPKAKINNVYASTEAGSLFAAKGDCFQIPSDKKSLFRIIDNELQIHKSLLGQSESFNYDGEFYKTGDLVEWVKEEEGLFKFKSRKNELINVGGYKVNPSEIEDVLLSIDGIEQVKVYGKPNSILGTILCADVKADAEKVSEISIKLFLKDKLQDFKIPRRIKFVDSFSLTRTGKLKRS